jgi:DNA ligase (NAD+)
MKPAVAAARVAWLRAEIRRHNRLYYEADRPEITDAQYDDLLRELETLERNFPALAAPDSPTRTVGFGRPRNSPRSSTSRRCSASPTR